MFDDLIISAASVYGLDIQLLKAQIQVESGFDSNAFRYEKAFFDNYLKNNDKALSKIYGPLGACSFGMMQVLLEVAMELGFADRPERLFIPSIGLAYGCKKMQGLLAWSKSDYNRALSAYNSGIGSPLNMIYVNKVRVAIVKV
jgi:soluble lytic murein transglycosylase-like protein